MSAEPGYPVTMVHPQHKAAVVATGHAPASLERFPSVTVSGADDELMFRAQGYLRYGEAAPQEDYHEYPKILRHPDHKDEILARTEATFENGRVTGTFVIAGTPEVMPDVIVSNKAEEDLWRSRNYVPAGEYNRQFLDAVTNNTVDDEIYEPDEYPKWIDETDANGNVTKVLLSRDPNLPEEVLPTPEYPKFENGQVIYDPRFPAAPDPKLYPMYLRKEGAPIEEGVIVKDPKEEFEVRQKWKKEQEQAKQVVETKEKEPIPKPAVPAASTKSSKVA